MRSKLDASDLVQDTLLAAWQARDDFRGSDTGQIAAWLRRILANRLANARRDLERRKRSLGRERSLLAALDESSVCLERWLASHWPSPGEQAERAEMLCRIAAAMEQLPEAQRQAIVLRYWRGCTLPEAARELGRSQGDVAVLTHRGMKRLRVLLAEGPGSGRKRS
jgi:RNA polymerase sigma-70 factor (ECF subfamily)